MTIAAVSSVKSSAMEALERVAPRFVWRRRIHSWGLDTNEAEQDLLPWVCDPSKTSIDAGAAEGAYAARMLLHSARVIAFEPRAEAAAKLARLFRNTSILTVEQTALSNEAGEAILRRPADRPMLSTIESVNALTESTPGAVNPVAVPKKRLDDYGFRGVGFVKIDVEGHEVRVLEGAVQTLERERPALLIEIEHRHNSDSFAAIGKLLAPLGYRGFFLSEGRLIPVERFSVDVHQNPANLASGRRIGPYVNNFLFLPRERVSSIPAEFAPVKG